MSSTLQVTKEEHKKKLILQRSRSYDPVMSEEVYHDHIKLANIPLQVIINSFNNLE